MAGTTVIYNGVQIENCTLQEFDQTIEYDGSGTDVVRHKFRVSVEGIMHGQGVAGATQNVRIAAPATPTAGFTEVSRRLGTAAQEFRLLLGGDLLLQSLPHTRLPNADADLDNGPKPSNVSITRIWGTEMARVKFTIETCKQACVYGGKVPFVLNNRWTVQSDIDVDHYMTRTIAGEIKLSRSTIPAQQAIGFCVPGLERGYRREAITFEVQKDGLAATYRVTDRQISEAAPWPATRMQGQHTEATSNGQKFFSDVRVHLWGGPDASKRDLIAAAVAAADAKVDYINRINGTDVVPVGAAIVDLFGEKKEVEVQIRLAHTPKDITTRLMNIRGRIGTEMKLKPLKGHVYDHLVSRAPSLKPLHEPGQINITQLLSVYKQTPCDNRHAIYQGKGKGSESAGDGESVQAYPSPSEYGRSVEKLPKGDDSLYSPATKQAIYTYATTTNDYRLIDVRCQAPIANYSDNYAATGPTSIILQLAAPIAVRIIRVAAERVGEWPKFPEPVASFRMGKVIATRKHHFITIDGVSPAPDGRHKLYSATATYLYYLDRPPRLKDKVESGVLPFVNLNQDDKVAYGDDFYDKTALGPGGLV